MALAPDTPTTAHGNLRHFVSISVSVCARAVTQALYVAVTCTVTLYEGSVGAAWEALPCIKV